MQGYGRRSAAAADSWVYPGSGATADSRPPRRAPAAPPPPGDVLIANGGVGVAAHANGAACGADLGLGAAAGCAEPAEPPVDEDPGAEFEGSDSERPPASGPRVINVGIPGPGAGALPPLWRQLQPLASRTVVGRWGRPP